MLSKILTVMIVVGVAAAEYLAVLILLPAPPEAAAATVEAALPKPPADLQDLLQSVENPQTELDLGEFVVSAYQPASNATLRITCHLYGTADAANAAELTELLAAHQNRLRDQVIITLRSSEMTDLNDPGLGLIKRRILETTRQTLGKPLINAVMFSTFTFIEK
jgi:flagellar FliL protein